MREKETDVQDRLQRNLTILFSVWDLNAYAVAARPLFDAWTLSHHTKQRRGKEEEGGGAKEEEEDDDKMRNVLPVTLDKDSLYLVRGVEEVMHKVRELVCEGKSSEEVEASVNVRALFPNIALIPHSCHPNVKVCCVICGM